MNFLIRFAQQSVSRLVRVACVLALVSLALMAYGILFPRPLNVILSMSLGHAVGMAAASCYGLAVLIDATRRRSSIAPPAGPSPPSTDPEQTKDLRDH